MIVRMEESRWVPAFGMTILSVPHLRGNDDEEARRRYAVTLSALPWLPSMNGLHGFARIGPFVFHTTLN